MRTLDRKMWRDLWEMKGQALAIALVIVSGVATFIISVSTYDSLRLTQDTFYRDFRFADLFVSLKRAPESVGDRLREIPGVGEVETRVVAPANLEVAGFPEPVRGLIVSVPDAGQPSLDRLSIRRGRTVAPGRDDEVVVSEAFAAAHGLSPGDRLAAVVNGRRRTLVIAGLGISPEYVYQIGPGSMFPDFRRYGVLWMGRNGLAAAFDMEGAFNDAVMELSAGANSGDVIDRTDALLAPYGGLGAYGRKDQVSHRYLSEELRQLSNMAAIFPVIFLGVAAFLLNVVVGRLINTQREQIAALKAFGYGNRAIGLHYVKLVVLIVLAGACGGTAAGAWLGRGLSRLYMRFYRFPYLLYRLDPGVVATAVLITMGAALLGTLFAVLRAARLPPAAAMRPEPPESYRETAIERVGIKRLLSQPARMIARHIGRRPVKSLLTIAGIAFSCAILMMGGFQKDAINFMVDVQFRQAHREDLSVTFTEPASRRALFELQSLPGVLRGEPFRAVPARLRFGHRSYRTSIQGEEPGGSLSRLLDTELRSVPLPPEGIVLTDHLGKILGARPGDRLTVEILEGSRPVREVPVEALVRQYVGVAAYMDLSALNRLLREGDAISGAYLAADGGRLPGIYEALNERPRVAGIVARENAIRSFYETMAGTLLIFTFVNTLLAGTIAFGVVYNNARIALSERGRELASLRVLGYTRGEISYILLGELGVLTMAAIPVGFLIGTGLSAYIAASLESDLYRVPLVLTPGTFAFAASVVLLSAVVSGLIVRRRLARLDLVAVLKTRE